MKKVLLSLMMMFVAAVATNTAMAQEAGQNGAKIEFEKEVHDYGTIDNGANGQCTFNFKNTGSAPLIISNAKGSCGCTVPSWPKEPIMPGKSAAITVKYDTKRPGAINKSVTITSNAVNTPTKVIRIKGNVKPKPQSGTPVSPAGPANK
jgi:Protein of unknown function (DUF1573)